MKQTMRKTLFWVPKFFLWVLPLLDVRHCRKLSSYSFSRKTYDLNSRKWQKPHFGPDLGSLRPNSGRQFFFSFKNLALSVTRYHGQLLCFHHVQYQKN